MTCAPFENTVVMNNTSNRLCRRQSGAVITNQPTGDGLWSTPGNWIGGVAPANGDSVTHRRQRLCANGGYCESALDYLFSNVTAGITLMATIFCSTPCLSVGCAAHDQYD